MKWAGMAAALGLALAGAATGAHAQQYINTYQFTSLFPVTDINILTEHVGSGDVTYSFDASPGDNTITNPFPEDPATRTFMLGVAQDLPGDPAGQKHLVLFTNDGWAESAEHIAFGTLFPNTDEDELIAYLQGSGVGPGVFGFADGDAENGPNGDLAFLPGDSFTEIAFSDGQIIGVGQSTTTPAPTTVPSAPEPGTWLLLSLGVGLCGLALRRRRGERSVPAFA
jgi:hypothetical protein